jgi:hypothetical protein
MALIKRKDSPLWWVEFEFHGQRYRQSAGTSRRRKAEEFERLLRQRVHDEVVLGRRPTQPMRFEDAVRRYTTTHLKTLTRLPKTHLADAYALAKLVRKVGGDTLLEQITTPVVAALKEEFVGAKALPATANKYLASTGSCSPNCPVSSSSPSRTNGLAGYAPKRSFGCWRRASGCRISATFASS